MVNYELGKIYIIESNVSGDVYIGSTCEPTLARRLAGHVIDYKRFLNGKYLFRSYQNMLVAYFDVLKQSNDQS